MLWNFLVTYEQLFFITSLSISIDNPVFFEELGFNEQQRQSSFYHTQRLIICDVFHLLDTVQEQGFVAFLKSLPEVRIPNV